MSERNGRARLHRVPTLYINEAISKHRNELSYESILKPVVLHSLKSGILEYCVYYQIRIRLVDIDFGIGRNIISIGIFGRGNLCLVSKLNKISLVSTCSILM